MEIKVRRISEADIPAMVEIEREITSSGKLGALERTLQRYVEQGDSDLLLGAEVEGTLAGFILGEIRPWEFGEEEDVGWIKVVGVAPKYQGQGIGRRLGEALMKALRTRGIHRVRTLVEWDAGDVITYFKALGFDRSNYIALERQI